MSASVDSTIKHLVREVIPRRLHKAPLDDAMSLRGELGIDSLGLMSLAFRIEEELRIDLMGYAEQVANVETMGDLMRLVAQIGKADSA